MIDHGNTVRAGAGVRRRGLGRRMAGMRALLAGASLLALGLSVPATAQDRQQHQTGLEAGAAPPAEPGLVRFAQADPAQPRRFDIPAGDLQAALLAFSQAVDLQLLYPAELTAGFISPGVQGAYAPEAALRRLLDGTELEYRFSGPDTVTLAKTDGQDGDGPMRLDPVTVVGTAGSRGYQPPVSTNVGIDPFGGSIKETPATVNVIPRQFIEDRAPLQVQDLADYLPGVNVIETSGGTGNTGIAVRGFTFDGNEVALNGQVQRIFSTQSRGFANIERVEVLKGSAGVEAGVVEPGGVVNLVTKKPQDEATVDVSAEVGSWDLFGVSLDATGPITEDKNLLYRFITEYQTRESFRDNVDQERVLVAPSLQWNYGKRSSALLEFEYIYQDQAYDRGTFYLEGAGFKDNFAPIEFSAHEPDDSLKSHSGRVSLSIDQWLTDIFSLRGKASYIREDYLSKGARNPDLRGLYIPGTNLFSGNSTIARSFTRFDGYYQQILAEAEALAGFETGPVRHDTLIGLEFARATSNNRGQDGQTVWPLDAFNPIYGTDPVVIGLAADGVGRDLDSFRGETYKSVYGQYKLTAWERFHILGGVRFDDAEFTSRFTRNVNTDPEGPEESFGNQVWSYRLAAGVNVTEQVTVFGGFSNASIPQSGTDRQGDPFDPLESTSYDAGVKVGLFDEKALFTLSFFDIKQTNLTEPDPDNLPGENFSALIGEVKSRGIEAELTGEITENLDILAGVALVDTEILESNSGQEGNRLYSVPLFEASLWAKYDFSELLFRGFSAALGVVHVGDREGDNDNSFELPSYTRVDAGAYYAWKDLRVELRVENVFDTTYFLGSQNRSRNIIPGAPRNVLASLFYRF